MELNYRVASLLELINCCHPLQIREYDSDSAMHLITDTPYPGGLFDCFFRYSRASAAVRKLLDRGDCAAPCFLSNNNGIMWSCCFTRPGQIPRHFYLLGPFFISAHKLSQLKDMLLSRDHPEELRRELIGAVDSIPVLPLHEIIDFTLMLHYCVSDSKTTAESIDMTAIEAPSGRMGAAASASSIDDHSCIRKADLKLAETIRSGNTGCETAPLLPLMPFEDDPAVEDPLMEARANAILLAERCCAAAIEGELPSVLAYEIRDHYAKEVQKCEDLHSVSSLQLVMAEDFTKQVNRYRSGRTLSHPIQFCCDYIRSHIDEAISLSQLAGFCGYTEYYFSRKFKKEVGLTPSEFINQSKIMRAKLLLRDSNSSVEEISRQLSFSSRSYFSSVFMEIAGVSPSVYRKNNRE